MIEGKLPDHQLIKIILNENRFEIPTYAKINLLYYLT